MAVRPADRAVDGFGRVSRRVGTAFEYLLVAATLFGLAILAFLLVFVANDAIRPLTADPRWHLVFLLTLVLPASGTGVWYWQRNRSGLRFGVQVIALLMVSLLFGGGLALIFIDIVPPATFMAYLLMLAVVAAAVVLVQRESHRLAFPTEVAVVLLVAYVVLGGIPGPVGALAGLEQIVPNLAGLLLAAPVYPADYLLLIAALGLPAAVGTAHVLAVSTDGSIPRVRATAVLLIAIAATVLLGAPIGLTAVPAVVLGAVSIVPTVAYAWVSVHQRPYLRDGLVIPAVLIGGALVGAALVGELGFAGPQSWVTWEFLTSPHSRNAENAGVYPAIAGSILLMLVVIVLAFPLGVGAAVYLEEYAPRNRLTRFIDVNISNLAGVPSVVYGLLGLGVFVTYLNRGTGTVLVGGATLALLILPIVIIAAREAIRSVPSELRQASYGMGATRWQTVRRVVIPRAFPGILTGTILALGRAIGETAPLIMIGAPSVVFSVPTELSAKVSAMPLQVYAWASLFAGPGFYEKAVPAGVVVLLVALLAMNSVAIVLRNRFTEE
jgi:phosphate ABC transporter membrane protein 2, PhoT family (TC 3.A.1.7.1)